MKATSTHALLAFAGARRGGASHRVGGHRAADLARLPAAGAGRGPMSAATHRAVLRGGVFPGQGERADRI